MKSFIIGLLFALIAGFFTPLQAQDYGLYWKYKDYDGINFTAGRAVFDIASLFVDERAERRLLGRVNKVRVMVFPERSPITDRDMRRFDRKAQRRHLEDIVMVRHGKDHVRVLAKERRNALRKVVVFVRTPEEAVFVSVKGNLRWKDVQKLIDKYGGEGLKKKGKSPEPAAEKVPVSRI